MKLNFLSLQEFNQGNQQLHNPRASNVFLQFFINPLISIYVHIHKIQRITLIRSPMPPAACTKYK